MNVRELRGKNVGELGEELRGRLREQFNLRMQKGAGQLTQTHQVRKVRRDIARIKGLLGDNK